MNARLILNDKSSVNLAMKYRLEGLLVFDNPLAIVQLDQAYTASEFKLPLVITPPIEPEKLTIEPSASLSNTEFRVARVGERYALVGVMSETDEIPSTGITERVTVRSVEPPVDAVVDLILKQSQPVTASPSVLRLRPNADGTKYSAKMLVRIHTGSADKLKSEGRAIIDCMIDGRVPNAVPKHLGNDVYSVSVSLSQELVEFMKNDTDDSHTIKVSARTENGTWSVENAVMIEH